MHEYTVGHDSKPPRKKHHARSHEGAIRGALTTFSSLTLAEVMDVLWEDARTTGKTMPKSRDVVRDLRALVQRDVVAAVYEPQGTRYVLRMGAR